MSALIIDGNRIARELHVEARSRIVQLEQYGIKPGLAVVLLGEDPASISYVTAKEKLCSAVGITSRDIRLPQKTNQESLLRLIEKLNFDNSIHGILVQLPLPHHIDENAIINAIIPSKDVDGFHPTNVGRLMLNLDGFIPCTPWGIIQILQSIHAPIKGADIVIIGRSRIVGAPLANLLFRNAYGGNATVTVCHTHTVGLAEKVRRANIVVTAVGQPNLITGDMVKPGAIVIDVGINRVRDTSREKGYRLVGDVNFESVRQIADAITPVPGGVGPLTRAMLLSNTIKSAEKLKH